MGITSFETPDAPFAKQVQQALKVDIDATARDAGSSPTTYLRAGLVLGEKTADGTYVEYDDDGTDDGRRVAAYILMENVDVSGGADVPAVVMAIGEAVAAKCYGYDAAAAVDLAKAGTGAGFITFE